MTPPENAGIRTYVELLEPRREGDQSTELGYSALRLGTQQFGGRKSKNSGKGMNGSSKELKFRRPPTERLRARIGFSDHTCLSCDPLFRSHRESGVLEGLSCSDGRQRQCSSALWSYHRHGSKALLMKGKHNKAELILEQRLIAFLLSN